jgi:hypothetical protein
MESTRSTLPVPVAVALVELRKGTTALVLFEEKSSSAWAVFRVDASFACEGASEPENVRCRP